MPVDKKFEADGVTINKEKALAMIEQYNTPEKVAAGLKNSRQLGTDFSALSMLTHLMTR